MRLTEQEIQSAVWIKLREHMEQKLAALRSQNDGDLSHEQTIKLRGRVAQLKELLALANTTPAQAELDA